MNGQNEWYVDPGNQTMVRTDLDIIARCPTAEDAAQIVREHNAHAGLVAELRRDGVRMGRGWLPGSGSDIPPVQGRPGGGGGANMNGQMDSCHETDWLAEAARAFRNPDGILDCLPKSDCDKMADAIEQEITKRKLFQEMFSALKLVARNHPKPGYGLSEAQHNWVHSAVNKAKRMGIEPKPICWGERAD